MTFCADDERISCPLFQAECGGEMPTSALQLKIRECSYEYAANLNRKWHSALPFCDKGSMWRGFKVAFCAEFSGVTYAVAIWSSPVNQTVDDGYTSELRRLAIASDAPKNSGSRLLAVMVRLLSAKYPILKRVISYQACDVHDGTIYKAAGWNPGPRTKFSPWGTRKRRKPRGWRQREYATFGHVVTPSTRKPPQTTSDKIRWEKDLKPNNTIKI
jgi:hypothetical protein